MQLLLKKTWHIIKFTWHKRGRNGIITTRATWQVVSKMCFQLRELRRVVGCWLRTDKLRWWAAPSIITWEKHLINFQQVSCCHTSQKLFILNQCESLSSHVRNIWRSHLHLHWSGWTIGAMWEQFLFLLLFHSQTLQIMKKYLLGHPPLAATHLAPW